MHSQQLAVLLLLAVVIGFPILLVVTWLKVQRIDGLARRIEQLERRLEYAAPRTKSR